jgi:hypothetical protein
LIGVWRGFDLENRVTKGAQPMRGALYLTTVLASVGEPVGDASAWTFSSAVVMRGFSAETDRDDVPVVLEPVLQRIIRKATSLRDITHRLQHGYHLPQPGVHFKTRTDPVQVGEAFFTWYSAELLSGGIAGWADWPVRPLNT